jgi:hypothetical protein
MQKRSCFGSLLAFEPKAQPCASCHDSDQCGQIAEGRKPSAINIASMFLDVDNRPMSYSWLTKAEQKAIREKEKQDLMEEE